MKAKIAFLVSAPRSGSTLLSRILDSHSQIASPFEFGVPQLLFGDRKEVGNLNKLDMICDYYGINFDEAKLDPNYLFHEILAKEGKELLVIKDPRHSIYLDRVFDVFSDVPIIHLTRDARSVAKSKMFKKFRNTLRLWRKYNTQILEKKSMFSSYTHVRYEDFVADPDESVSKLVEFLGYEYEPGMKEYWNFKHAGDELPDKNVKQGLDMHDKVKNLGKIEKSKPVELSGSENIVYHALFATRKLNRQLGHDI